jgi:hypothetical protein
LDASVPRDYIPLLVGRDRVEEPEDLNVRLETVCLHAWVPACILRVQNEGIDLAIDDLVGQLAGRKMIASWGKFGLFNSIFHRGFSQ